MAAKRRWVYFFGNGKAAGKGDEKELLGGKGAGLAAMTRIGLPVPAGFTITTEACADVLKKGSKWPSGLEHEVRQNLAKLEKTCGKKFGRAKDPLLVSVRSGAAVSMPGMMETILNLGLNDDSVQGLADAANNLRFALDAYRRLIMMYGSTAKGVKRSLFDSAFEEIKRTRTAFRRGKGPEDRISDTDVNAEELEHLVQRFKQIYAEQTGEPFPQDPFTQLKGAIDAVFASWNAEKSLTYRRVEKITGLNGTAVNVCQMVFGNTGSDSGTGVCFTRDPSSGENIYYGDLLINAQGEDVVAGIRTPLHLEELKKLMPEAYDQLEAVRVMLEVHYKDMQDLEFTIERNKLYILQCRTGKRSPGATFKIAVDQATKGIVPAAVANRLAKKKYLPKQYAAAASKPVITREEAIRRIKDVDIERLFYPILDPEIPGSDLSAALLGEGINAVPGAACGEIAFTAEHAERRAAEGASVILVRHETSPEDVGGMSVAAGVLTATGGKTSHAAVVARGWGKCCIVGCEKMHLDNRAGTVAFGGRTLRQGDTITLDGGTGQVYAGCFNLVRPSAPPEYDTLMSWCDQVRKLRVHTNADTPADAARAVALGAEGIGLCRTEHMFFDPSEPMRIRSVREMILADEEKGRRRALNKLLGFQRKDFEGVFEAMSDKPVTIRLLDPPLHEFLPQVDDIQTLQELAHDMNSEIRENLSQVEAWDHDLRAQLEAQLTDVQTIQKRIRQLHESNPMLGHRGCRLSITYPEILEMQVRAIMEAAVNCTQRGVKVLPEIMIPLSIDAKELGILINRTRATADAILKEKGVKLKYLVGTMIETPRAALTADRMAEVAEFFSFGTNDLTQLAMALSRDDAGRFLTYYVDKAKAGIFDHDPFQSLDIEGVGQLVEMAIAKSRATRPAIKLGICGEHGGDPESIQFCHRVGLDYVSCSPLRVPIARLSAAQAALKFDGAGRRSTAVKVKRTVAARSKAKTARKASAKKTKAKVKKASAKKTKAKVKKATARKAKAKKAGKGKKATAKKAKPKKARKVKRAATKSKARKKKKAKRAS